tara:strand:+ start:65919 stop:66074 length:156 start_codon:yes stop_codon:yes gene_type:complete
MTTDKSVTPTTKQQSRSLNDQRAASIYACRSKIDQKHADMKLKRQLREVWS